MYYEAANCFIKTSCHLCHIVYNLMKPGSACDRMDAHSESGTYELELHEDQIQIGVHKNLMALDVTD